MRAFILALQFLTRIPLPLRFNCDDRQLGQSVLYYPLVGIIIGLLLWSVALATANISASLQAALLLTIWVLISGGLHLDGLADCADAWAGGLGDREKSLRILKDPAAGPVAVIILLLTLLLKWSALQSLAPTQMGLALLIAPVLGRTAILPLMLTTRYVRQNGLATPLLAQFPKTPAKLLTVIVATISYAVVGGLPLMLAICILFWIRHMAVQRLGGCCGDVFGAAVEWVELAVLLGLALA